MQNIFRREVTDELIQRIHSLTPGTEPRWGKMNVAQMLAHCCVPYELVYESHHAQPGPLRRFFLRLLVKPGVTNEKPYPKSSFTAPAFKVPAQQDFQLQRGRLVGYVVRTCDLGPEYFAGRKYPSFGVLTQTEWNNLFYKHLDHHLNQFGA